MFLQSTRRSYCGPYLTLKTTIANEEVRRSYSICAAPSDGELRVAVKEIEGESYPRHSDPEAGMIIESMLPMGNFKWQPTGEPSHVVGWAAGSGITPIMSIAKTVLRAIQAARLRYSMETNSNSIIFKDAFEDLRTPTIV